MTEDINEQVAGEPTAPEAKAEPKAEPTDDAAALLATLKDLGVDSPEKIQGMATASQQTGKAFNEVGDLRKMNQELQSKLDQILSSQQTPQDPYEDGQTVDLAKLMDQRLEKFWTKQQQAQNEATNAYYREMGEIQNSPRFAPVKDMWEAHMASPDTQAKLRQGRTTLKDEFNNLVFTFQENLLQRAYKTVSATQPQTVKPPHVEAGDTQAIPMPTVDGDHAAQIKQTVKARSEGNLSSDDALQKLVNTFLPNDDSMWQT